MFYSWSRRWFILVHFYDFQVFSNDPGIQIMQLRIMTLESNDFGRYHCKARNELGSDSDVVLLSGNISGEKKNLHQK